MKNSDKILDALESATSDWEGDFIFTVTASDEEFDVSVTHRFYKKTYYFAARADDGVAEMDWNEDSWEPITQENLFAWMWFELSGEVTK